MRLPAFITERLHACAWRVISRRSADVQIGADGYGDPYMLRWWAIPRNRYFNIYIHRYYHDDDRILHSHPWWSVSICLQGALAEFFTPTAAGANKPEELSVRHIRSGHIVFRSPDMFHRLEVKTPGTVTLFLTGPNIKSWYFACKRGLIHWKDFVNARDTGQVGAGCGEHDDYPTQPRH